MATQPVTGSGTGAHYAIRGGMDGRERLRLLSRVLWPATRDLLQRAWIAPGMACLDAGCGGGDVAFEMTRLTGPGGNVVALDMDPIKIESARQEAAALHLTNIDFRVANIDAVDLAPEFDLVHARFLLSHLRHPQTAVEHMRDALRPGGTLAVADIDFAGHICDPDCAAFRRYVELYTETVRHRGGNAGLGRRLPRMLMESGFKNVQMQVVQPAGTEGEVKVIAALTMELIGDAAVSAGLTTPGEVAQLVAELYEFADTPGTMMSAAPIVQTWGVRATAV